MAVLKRMVRTLDGWQRNNRIVGPAFAVTRKFSDDEANLFVVALGWYGFTAIFPLLLVAVAVLGFIGASSLGPNIVHTLHQFPVIGAQLNTGPGASSLHGSVIAAAVGLVGLLYGAQGVTQTAEQAMARVWNVKQLELPAFLTRLVRSLAGLATIGGAFFANALAGSIAAGYGHSAALRIALVVAMLIVNVGFYFVAFWVLTPALTETRQLLPGSVVGAIGFTVLTTLGTGLMEHHLRNSAATYGTFASVIGVVAYLLLLAKLSIYAAELNPVLAHHLWPRALPTAEPTPADNEALRDLTHQQQRRPDERVGVGSEANSEQEAADDTRQDRSSDRPPAHPGPNR